MESLDKILYNVIRFAAKKGDVETVYLCISKAKNLQAVIGNSNNLFISAIRSGNTKLLDVLQHKIVWDKTDSARIAALSGNIEVMAWIIGHFGDCPLPLCLTTAAAQVGDKKMLEFLCQHGCLVGKDALYAAMSSGSLKCVRYLRKKHRIPWDIHALECACDKFHPHLLKFAFEDCYYIGDGEWDEYFTAAETPAAVTLIKWMIETKHLSLEEIDDIIELPEHQVTPQLLPYWRIISAEYHRRCCPNSDSDDE